MEWFYGSKNGGEKVDEKVWERRAAILITVILGGAVAYLALRFALPVLLPFLVAWVLSMAVRPIAERLERHTGISRRVFAVFLLLLLLMLALLLVGFSTRRLLEELRYLLERLLGEGGSLSELVNSETDYFELLTSRIPLLERLQTGERFGAFRERFNEMADRIIGSLLTSLTAGIPNVMGRMVSSLPTVLFVALITVISVFYFCLDGERLLESVTDALPVSLRRRLLAWRGCARRLSWRYLRSYLFLLLLTFAELFLGFCILGVDYAFLLAALVALVDLLPVLGVGTVLLPWAAILLLQQRFGLGFGLLILYLAVTVLRQIVEPRLVGKSLGLHPLLTLLASYAGWRLMGVFGMLIGPFLALAVKALWHQAPR